MNFEDYCNLKGVMFGMAYFVFEYDGKYIVTTNSPRASQDYSRFTGAGAHAKALLHAAVMNEQLKKDIVKEVQGFGGANLVQIHGVSPDLIIEKLKVYAPNFLWVAQEAKNEYGPVTNLNCRQKPGGTQRTRQEFDADCDTLAKFFVREMGKPVVVSTSSYNKLFSK